MASNLSPSVPVNMGILGAESQLFPSASLATNESLGVFRSDIQDQSRIQASNPLIGQDVFNWNESNFFQQAQRNESKEASEDSKIANSVPVAAMLTDVFQHDQYISGQAVASRKDSSSTDEEK